MILSQKSVDEYKKIFKKEYGVDLSDAEAREQGGRLFGFFEILFEHAMIEEKRKKRLKKEPEGFFLEPGEGSYTCAICDESHYGNEIWWTPEALRCEDCWRNTKEKVIPPLDYDIDNKVWIKDWQIQSDYGIHPMTARKFRRLSELVGRDLKRKGGSIYCTVYLVSENKEFLKKYAKKPKIKVKYIDPLGREIEL